ncbi:MAG: LamG-like jellyroll fold domain-containing protein [Opitutaceae bacterium]|nr:LamG-like jellyroll fold domain-containing protein [Opitutaceae bacterium]
MKPALLFTAALALVCPLGAADALKSALLFHASFDLGPHADLAAGDTQIYTAPDRTRTPALPGLHAGDAIAVAPGEGKYGAALRFRHKTKEQVFFKGERNLGYQAKNWSGSCSFWMRLDPEQGLAPGYCDPVQFVAQAWGEGNMFVEFSKDHTPRHFRYVIMAITRLWNPTNAKYEEMKRRPLVAVEQPPFRRDRWTHVCFTFGNANTGAKDGWGRLYLDGVRMGEFTGWENSFNWQVEQSALTLGLGYTGWLDDLAVFSRALTDSEVATVFTLKNGIAELRR